MAHVTGALELVIKGRDEPPVAYACPKCGLVFSLRLQPKEEDRARLKGEAEQHCVKYCACNNLLDGWRISCSACQRKEQDAKEMVWFAKAEKVKHTDYGDPVYWEGHTGSMGDGYFANVDELIDYCESEDIPVPEFVWACTSTVFKLSAEALLEREFEKQDIYDGAMDAVGEKERGLLQAFLDTWTARQNIVSWQYTVKTAVLFELD